MNESDIAPATTRPTPLETLPRPAPQPAQQVLDDLELELLNTRCNPLQMAAYTLLRAWIQTLIEAPAEAPSHNFTEFAGLRRKLGYAHISRLADLPSHLPAAYTLTELSQIHTCLQLFVSEYKLASLNVRRDSAVGRPTPGVVKKRVELILAKLERSAPAAPFRHTLTQLDRLF